MNEKLTDIGERRDPFDSSKKSRPNIHEGFAALLSDMFNVGFEPDYAFFPSLMRLRIGYRIRATIMNSQACKYACDKYVLDNPDPNGVYCQMLKKFEEER